MKSIPQFLIAAPTSGSGKTTISRGLMALLVKKGLKVQPFKCGPDYIDTKYHAVVCGCPSINLDTFMASKEHVRKLYARYAAHADVCIAEGMMGMFDGYDRDRGSSAEIAKLLNLPVVLVVDAKSAAYSMAPLLSGFIHFQPEIQIAGVIFNRVGSPRHYEMLQEVCSDLNVTCLGYLPKQKALEQESRHLGLDFSRSKETDGLELLTELLEHHINWQLLLERTTSPVPQEIHEEIEKTDIKKRDALDIWVARNDESFSFLYAEHLEKLHRMGTVTFFNPETDCSISQHADLLYLPGGYPENVSERLAKAERTKNSIRNYVESGGKVLAECGGMIYLSQGIINESTAEEAGRKPDRMAGIFPFYISNEKKNRKLSLGYRQFDYNGQSLRGHEFHYTQFGRAGEDQDKNSELTLPSSITSVYNAKGQLVNTPVFRYKNVIASYTHLYWGEIDLLALF